MTLEIDVENGLRYLATAPNMTRKRLVDGLCGMMSALKPLDISEVRHVLERRELGVKGLAEISRRFFEVSAQCLFPGLETPATHYAHSFLNVSLMAKSFELQIRESEAEGWGNLSGPNNHSI